MCRTGTCAGSLSTRPALVTGDATVTRGCAGAGDANSGSDDNGLSDTKRRLRSRIWADLPPKGTALGEHNCWRRGPPYPRMALCTGHRVAEAEAPERLTTVTAGAGSAERCGRRLESPPEPTDKWALGERPRRHLKPGRRLASERRIRRTEEASGHPIPGRPPTVRHMGVFRRIGGRRNVQRRRCRNRDPDGECHELRAPPRACCAPASGRRH